MRTGATMKEEGKKVETETEGGEDPRRGGEGGDASTARVIRGRGRGDGIARAVVAVDRSRGRGGAPGLK